MDNSYKNLDIYTRSKELVKRVYDVVNKFPIEERFALSSQIRRAIISVPSNIAEGMGRSSIKEQCHFIEIANASLNEVMCQLELAYELKLISDDDLRDSEDLIKSVAQMLFGLRKSILSKN